MSEKEKDSKNLNETKGEKPRFPGPISINEGFEIGNRNNNGKNKK